MAIGSYSQLELDNDIAPIVKGTYTTANFLLIANRAARKVVADIDLRSCIRKSALSPNLFDDMFEYTLPVDTKGDKIVDLKPQINRGRFDDWRLTTAEEFDRTKRRNSVNSAGDPIKLHGNIWMGDNLLSIQRDDLVNKLLISKPIDDTQVVVSSLDAVGDWGEFGDGDNITVDADNYVKGSASLNWDIDDAAGTTAGIYNDALTAFDVEPYKSTGSVFVWAYITSATNLTNYILRVGSGASHYYSITVTTNNEGASFYAGWNLLRFDFINKSTTGTPDDDACTYAALYMTKDAAKVSETDYRFDHIIMKKGDHYDAIYYTRYPWQSSTGTFLEDATANTDLLNAQTDEYDLFVLKTTELVEEHLTNDKRAAKFEVQYEMKKAEYIRNNPSQALILETTYHEM